MQIISRKDAKAQGLKYYFTGKPCKRGHIDKRFVSSFWCMTCGREKASEAFRSLTGEKREAKREYERRRWQDPEFRKRQRLYQQHEQERANQARRNREWKKQNREKLARKSRAWYHANSERALEARKVYVAANRDRARIWGRKAANKRLAIKKDLFVEDVDPRVVFERDKGICGICREPVDVQSNWELDHIIPLSKRGPHSYANIQLAHRRCNRSKGAKVA